MRRCYTEALFFLPACRCVAKWLQDIGLFCTAGRNLRSVNESRTDTSSLCLMESNESSQHLLSIFYVTAESQVVGPSPEWNLVLDCNLSSGEPGCVFIRVGGGLHIYCIIVAPEGDPRPLQACPPSCFISVCSYMDIFLPSARLHYVRFLNNTQPPPPPHTLPPNLLPTPHHHTHTYTLLLMLVSHGQRRECLFLCAGSNVVNTHLITGSDGSHWLCSFLSFCCFGGCSFQRMKLAHVSALEAAQFRHATCVTPPRLMCVQCLGSRPLFSGTTRLRFPVKINLKLPEVCARSVIYLRAFLTLGIQTRIGVRWVASKCPGSVQIPLEISRPICAALTQTYVAF